MFPQVRTTMVLSLVMTILLVSSMAGCLSNDDDDNGNGNGKEDPVLANAGSDLFGKAGDALTLNASASSGPIQKYSWTIRGPNASSPDNITKIGMDVEHTFTDAGVYTVNLMVEGKKVDNNSTNTVRIFIDLEETHTGQLKNIQAFNKTYEYNVWPEVQSIKLKLTYPTTAGSPIALPMNLDMDVWTDGQTPYASTSSQTPNPLEDEQVEDLDLLVAGVITNEGFRVIVRWGLGTTPITVDFTLEVEIHYRAA